MVKANALDRLAGWISPAWGARRLQARHSLACWQNDQSARAAGGRWRNPNVDEEVRDDRKALLAEARRLMRTNPYACGAMDSTTANVVGEGFQMELRVRNRQGDLRTGENQAGQRVFEEWSRGADLTGTRSFGSVQQEMFREFSTAGECFMVRHIVPDRAVPLAVELRPAESLSDLENDSIKQGIEFDPRGRPAAYHFYTDPQALETERVPADRVIHFFKPHRIGAVRGLSPLGPVARSFDGLKRYLDHEIRRAEVSSSFVMLWKQAGGMPHLNAPSDRTTDSESNPLTVLPEGGGVVVEGAEGDSMDSFSPSIENTAFQAFVEVILRQVATGLGMSYELIARDFTKANFSSARQSSLEDRRQWEPRQSSFLNMVLRVFWDWWVAAANLGGVLPFAGQRIDWPAHWQPPGWHWVDPQKEVGAIKEAISMGLDNPIDAASRNGRDFYENIDKKAEAEKAAEELETTIDTGTTDGTQQNPAEEGGSADEGADEGAPGPTIAAA